MKKMAFNKKLNIVWIYAALILLIVVLPAAIVFGTQKTAENKKNSTYSTETKNGNATLTGNLNLNLCGGAQPDYPEPPKCSSSIGRNTTINAANGDQIIATTQTDSNGQYRFNINPGKYTLKVKGESASEGHDVLVKPGNNEFNFTASLHMP